MSRSPFLSFFFFFHALQLAINGRRRTLLLTSRCDHIVDTEGANWGYDTAWLFFGLGSLVCIMVWFYVPEPSQRNYAEMDEMYINGVPARKMRKYVTEVQLAQQQQIVEAEKLQ